ncbi:hypothetical protein ATANTOWER_020711 [Ataeniobius toweri]|uniref:Uncharacterized protein n=1 Tax=Ataeniobius toweri TaxID=208326 RepID=A0ABU7CAK4_9TELE|nr:hypothetical protein [Ataeniobius toweri]
MQITTLATTVLLILITTFNTVTANYTCYSSSSPEAKRISSVYDDHHSMGAFWHTNGSKLNPCTFSSIYSSKCSVCLNDSARPVTVLVVLRNLTSSVNLVMEGPNGHISFNTTDCPQPETIVRGSSTVSPGVTTRLGDSKPRGVGGRIGVISLASVVLLIIILIIRLKCNRQNSQTSYDGPHSVSSGPGPDMEMDLLGPVLSNTRGVAEGCLENL